VTAPREEWHLNTQRLGRRVLVFDCVDSTSTQVAAWADDPANDGLVILADEQLAGRGQHGRSWSCPPRAGVLLSVLLFPPPPLRRPALLTAWAAVAVCETIQSATGLQAKIKWPNDVLLRGRKVCGILIEQALGTRADKRGRDPLHSGVPSPFVSTVAGIGLNVNQTAESLAAADLPRAASLAVFAGKSFEVPQVARLLIQHLDEEYDRLCQGDFATLEACWKWRLGLLGKQVAAECHHGMKYGRLRELGWEGLELETNGGEILRLLPEEVRHLEPA